MTTNEYAANTARAFLAAEIAMASVNCEAPIVTFTLASSNRRSPGPRTIPWTAGPDPSTTTGDRESLVGGHPRRVRLSHCDRLRQQ